MDQPQHIAVRGLTHVYETGRGRLAALEHLDLQAGRGEFISVVGPSGGGKTTLLRIIGGLLEPTAGEVLVDGVPPLEARRRKSIGFVFQDPSLLPWRTVIQNVRLPLQLNTGSNRADSDEPERLLEAVGLARFRDYHPHQLSGGMRQRAALARALVLNPAVLLMDEPLGSLDEMTRAAMRYELLRLWGLWPKTVVFVTHSVQEAVLLGDRVVVLSSGPGRILDDLRVDLPRPRGEELERSSRFLDYVQHVKRVLSIGAGYGEPLLEARAGR